MEKGNNLYDTIKCEYIIFFFYPPRIFCFFQQTRTMASKHFSCSLQKNGASQKLHPIYMRAITKVVNHNSIRFFPKFLIVNGRLSKSIANLSPSQLKKIKIKITMHQLLFQESNNSAIDQQLNKFASMNSPQLLREIISVYAYF